MLFLPTATACKDQVIINCNYWIIIIINNAIQINYVIYIVIIKTKKQTILSSNASTYVRYTVADGKSYVEYFSAKVINLMAQKESVHFVKLLFEELALDFSFVFDTGRLTNF